MSASMPGVAAGRVRGQALRARNNTWVRLLMRVGLVSRGVVYGMLAYFAFDIARSGNSPEPASGQGALRAIARQPEGPALLAVLSSCSLRAREAPAGRRARTPSPSSARSYGGRAVPTSWGSPPPP